MKIIYIYNPSRAHKILPLLEGYNVHTVKRAFDLIGIRTFLFNNSVILIDTFGTYAVKGLVLSIILRLPLILRLRGEFFREEKERKNNKNFWQGKVIPFNFFAKLTLRRCSTVICNSNYLAREMRPFLERKTVHIVYNPYTKLPLLKNEIELCLPNNGFHLLTITNMNLKPKIAPTYELIQKLDADSFKSMALYWFICGKGHYFEKMAQVVKERGLENNIIIHQYVDDVRPLYAWADVMIHLTRMDAFPNCTMEAMMQGVPVITNPDSCGTVELVENNVNGLIGEDILSLIIKYKSQRELIYEHAVQGKKTVTSKFSVVAQRKEMQKILNLIS